MQLARGRRLVSGSAPFMAPFMPPLTLPRGREELPFTRLIIGDRMRKTAQRGSPKFHAIQVLVQSPKGLNQIAHNHIFCRFWHGDCSFVPYRTSIPPKKLKPFAQSCSPIAGRAPDRSSAKSGTLFDSRNYGPFRLRSSKRPAATSTIAASSAISANSAGSAPVIQT